MSASTLFEHPASKTLLIPLIIRANESQHKKSLFHDQAAQNIVASLPADAFNFSINPFMRMGTAVRVKYFDDLARNFLAKSEKPVIIQLGCGLDSRFSRVDAGKGIYINIDLPEVMNMRKQIMPQNNERDIDLTGDLVDRDWMDKVATDYAGHQLFFIIEGVLMYIEEAEVRKLFVDLAERFPGAQIAFDTAGSLSVRILNKKSAVQELNATMSWAYDDDGTLDTWHPRLSRLERADYFSKFKSRCGIWSLMRFTPIGKSSAMYHFQIKA